MPKINDRSGPYELLRKLGKGGFGAVWWARNLTAWAVSAVSKHLRGRELALT